MRLIQALILVGTLLLSSLAVAAPAASALTTCVTASVCIIGCSSDTEFAISVVGCSSTSCLSAGCTSVSVVGHADGATAISGVGGASGCVVIAGVGSAAGRSSCSTCLAIALVGRASCANDDGFALGTLNLLP